MMMSCQKPRGGVDRSEIGWWVPRETNDWLEPGTFSSRKRTPATQRCYQPLLPWKKLVIWAAIHRRKTCWCVKAAHPALLCASLCQPVVLLPMPIAGAQTSGSAKAGPCSHSGWGSVLTLQPAMEVAGFLGELRLLWICSHEMNSTSTKPPLHSRSGQADVWQGRRAEQEGTCFIQAPFRFKWHFVSDAKRHHPPSTLHSQLPTYISICQLSSSCSVPVKSPGFSSLSEIMLNCWDQILVTLELPNNPLLFFLSFYPFLLSVSQYRAKHRHNALQQDTGMTASLLRIVS